MTSHSTLIAALLLLALAPGCDCQGGVDPRTTHDAATDAHQDSGPSISGLLSFTIAPQDMTLTVVNGVALNQTYTAIGHFMDGSMHDISTQVQWSVTAPQPMGTFRTNVFTTLPSTGGMGQVSARANGVIVTTSITVIVQSSHSIAPTGGGAAIPSMPGMLFGGAVDMTRAPQLVYPNDGVLLPPNVGRVEVHWLRGPASNTLFEIGFTNAVTDVRFYVRCEAPAGVRSDGCIYEPNGDAWSSIAQTNRGLLPVTVTIRGTDDTGTAVGTSTTISIRFSRDPLMGTIYYWTTSSESILRYDFGAASGMAEPVITPAQADGGCVGCHAISRDGRRIFATVGGIGSGGMELYNLDPFTALRSAPHDHIVQFGSFNPDGTQMAGVWGDDGGPDQTRGLLFFDTRCDAANMATCGQIVSNLPIGGREVTHPSWSPDGAHIAYTDVDGNAVSQRPRHGAIGVVDQMGAGWGAPRFLVPRADGVSNINPDWAPDNAFLVMTRSTCPGGNLDDTDCNGDSDPSSVVLAVPASGGTPIELTRAMAPGAMDMGRTELNNTFGRFAPFEFVLSSGDVGSSRLMWVSFSTTRAYGLRNPPGGNAESGGRGTYLWMTGVRPEEVMAGTDPSFAAFALPFQDLTTSNHIAQWTTMSVGTPILM